MKYLFKYLANENVNPLDFGLPVEGTLDEAVDLAFDHGIEIELFDEGGFHQGYVHPDGNWSLF